MHRSVYSSNNVRMHNNFCVIVHLLITMSFLIGTTHGSEMWRYSSFGGISANKASISTGRKLTLEYLGSETVSWETDPNACSFSALGSSVTTLSCSRPGIHKVTLRVSRSGVPDELVTRHLQVRNLFQCFDWTAAVSDFTSSGVNLQVWIADQNEADLTGTMSQRSTWLTEQFAILGQQPTLEIYRHGLLREDVETECHTYNKTLGYWACQAGEVVYDGTTNIYIKGTSIQLMGCFVRDTFVHLQQEADNFTNAAYEVDMTISATHRSIIASPNADNIAVVVDPNGIFLTEDSFSSSTPPVVPAASARTVNYPMNSVLDILHQNDSFLVFLPMETLVGVAFTWHHFTILTDQSIYFLYTDNKTLYNTVSNTDVSADSLVGIRGWERSTEKPHQMDMDMVILWSASNVYRVKSDGTVTTVVMSGHYPSSYTSPQVVIIDAALSPFAGTLCMLAKLTESPNSGFFLFFYNFMANTWDVVTVSNISPTDTSLWHVNVLKQAMDSALVWGEQTAVRVTIAGDELLSLDDSYTLTSGQLEQLVQTHAGEFVFLTSDNMLLYGRASNQDLVQVPLGELPATDAFIWYDPLDQLYVLKSNGNSWMTRVIPLRSEVMGALYPNTSCQILHFSDNMHLPAYYVDKERQLTLWASLVYREADANSIKLTVEGTGMLMVQNTSVFQYNRNLVQQNLTVVIYHNESFTDVADYTAAVEATKAHIRVGLDPEKEKLGCPIRRSSVRTVTVDCPPERKIKIMKDINLGETCDKIDTFTTHRIVDGVLKETTETYDWSVLGCPLRVRSTKTFTPRLALYDGDTFVEEVPADFVVWEEYGQSSIEYNTTMAEVRCLKKAQTWSEMNAAGNSWSAGSYQHCFSSDDSTHYDLNEGKYQIFNKSNPVSLTFSIDYNGVYVFSARVIGRDYSFCSLETRFAVQVYDTNDTNNMVVLGICLLVFTSIFLILLGSSYFRFRVLTIREQEEEQKQSDEHLAEVKLVRESMTTGLLTPGIFISQPNSCASSLARVSGTVHRRESSTEQ